MEKTNYFTVEVYGLQARACAEYLGKRLRVVVDAELDWREWNDKENNRTDTSPSGLAKCCSSEHAYPRCASAQARERIAAAGDPAPRRQRAARVTTFRRFAAVCKPAPRDGGGRPDRWQYLERMAASRPVAAYDRVVECGRAVALARHFRYAEGLGRSPATVEAYFYDPSGEGAGGEGRYVGVCRGLLRRFAIRALQPVGDPERGQEPTRAHRRTQPQDLPKALLDRAAELELQVPEAVDEDDDT